MLGKLIRYEFLATAKVLLILDAVLLAMGISGFFVMASFHGLDRIQGETAGVLVVTSYAGWFLLYIFSLFAANIGTTIVLLVRYYRNLYSPEGYLTFTLPVRTEELLHAKIVSGSAWTAAGWLITGISALLLMTGFLQNLPPSERIELLESLEELHPLLQPGALLLALLAGIAGMMYRLLSLYFCISAGQLWQKHKIAGAVLCFFLLGVAERILTSAATIGRLSSGMLMPDFELTNFYHGTLGLSIVYSLACSVLFYLAIRYINGHRVNLD